MWSARGEGAGSATPSCYVLEAKSRSASKFQGSTGIIYIKTHIPTICWNYILPQLHTVNFPRFRIVTPPPWGGRGLLCDCVRGCENIDHAKSCARHWIESSHLHCGYCSELITRWKKTMLRSWNRFFGSSRKTKNKILVYVVLMNPWPPSSVP